MKRFEEVYGQLSSQIEDIEAFRLGQLKKSEKSLWWAGGALIAGIIALVLSFPGGLALGIVAAVLVVITGYLRPRKQYKNYFKEKVISRLIAALDPSFEYTPKSYISKTTYVNSKIFTSKPDRYSGEDLVTGQLDKTRFSFSELHTQVRHSDGKRTYYVTQFKGLFFVADFHKHFQGHTVVLPDTVEKALGGLGKFFQKLNIGRPGLVYMEHPEFEKHFCVYSTDQVEARYILTPDMLSRLLDLRKRLDCPISLSFLDDSVHLAIGWNRNILEGNIKIPANETQVFQNLYTDMADCLSLIMALNLNTRIWTKT